MDSTCKVSLQNNDEVKTVDTPYVTLHSALMGTFSQYEYAILILQGYMIGIIFGIASIFYVFDLHGKDEHGIPNPNGIAILMIDVTDLHGREERGIPNPNGIAILMI